MLCRMVEMDLALARERVCSKLVFIHLVICKVEFMYDDITTKD